MYRASVGEVPEGYYEVELGKAEVMREGTDITLIAWGAQTRVMMQAAEEAEKEGISCEVIDLLTLLPWDVPTSVRIVLRLLIAFSFIC